MAYNANLYESVDPTDGLGAKVLVPKSENTIDIHYKYNWTLSETPVRDYIPYIQLTEYKQVLSSEVSGFFYNVAGIADDLNTARRTIATSVTQTTSVLETNTKRALNSVANALGNDNPLFKVFTPENAINRIQNKLKSVETETAKNADVSNQDPYNSNLKAYTGLYAIEQTGWNYIMPFLTEANMTASNNQWGEPTGQARAALGKMLGSTEETNQEINEQENSGDNNTGVMGILGKMVGKGLKTGFAGVDLANALTPGAKLAETPQSFLGTGRDSISIQFYLYNTQNFEDIKRNWEFCYLFTYQNLPNRKGVNLLDPPCLYKALIPGYKQLPLCYVSDLKIENVGGVRLVDIDNDLLIDQVDKHVSSPSVKMIPEAYKITIQLTSVLYNARNIFSFVEDPSNKITVSVTGE